MTPRIGDLCSGYHGLGGAAEEVTGGRTAWLCENDAAPSALLAYRFPGLHNYGDLKALEWADDPVDVLTAGYPCQPFSGAGQRLGTGDPRHLFPWIARGIERMRPPLVLLENVRGHLSLGFDVVLAELDRIGYDVRWTLLRAADVGAPHGRSRLWIAARARESGGWPAPGGEPTALAEDGGWTDPASGLFGVIPARGPGTAGVMVRGLRWDSDALPNVVCNLLPTPTAQDAAGSRGHRLDGTAYGPTSGVTLTDAALGRLLPTPAVNDMGAGKTVEAWDDWTEKQKAKHGNGNGHGPSLHIEAARLAQEQESESWTATCTSTSTVACGTGSAPAATSPGGSREGWTPTSRPSNTKTGQLLPTPEASDGTGGRVSAEKGGTRDSGAKRAITLGTAVDPRHLTAWGPYAAAIARWENLTRPAPAPTERGRNGPRLSPAFVEWMLGLPAGWVTDVPGITRNAALKMLGNGVVEQCAAAAYALLGVSPDLWAEVAA